MTGGGPLIFNLSVSVLTEAQCHQETGKCEHCHDGEGIAGAGVCALRLGCIHQGDGDADDRCQDDDAECHGELPHRVDDGRAVRDVLITEL